MSTSINHGTSFRVYNVSIPTTTGGTAVVINDKDANAFYIQCRTATDIELYEGTGSSTYFTIKAGTVLRLEMNARNYTPFAIRSTSGTVNVEIIAVIE